jgi:pimeloyl-ACP methyl ester carboxylesterase
VVELQAETKPGQPDPVYVLQGGPGQAVTGLASYYGRVFAKLRKDRNIVLVDIRGTDRSNGLYCDIYTGSTDRMDHLFPPEAIRKCREKLERQTDLTQYSTDIFVEDTVDVLNALHIKTINIYGTSYGTRLAFELARIHPDRVRTMTLKGVVSPNFVMTDTYSRDALNVLRSEASDTQRRQLDALLKRNQIAIGGMEVSAGVLAEAIRTMLYTPELAQQVPKAVANGLTGDTSGFDKVLGEMRQTWQKGLAIGQFLSVTCSEDISSLNRHADLPINSTILGEFRRSEQMEACKEWPRAQIDIEFGRSFRTRVPTLLFSGALDPVTPPASGQAALKYLLNGRHFVLQNNGHPMGNRASCISEMMASLLDTRSPQLVANRCLR